MPKSICPMKETTEVINHEANFEIGQTGSLDMIATSVVLIAVLLK